MANTLKFGNGNWATKEGSTLAYNDENGNFKPLPFDFSRASKATVVNKDGLIEVVGSGEPRVDYLNNTKGALKLEPTRSNLISYSEDFSQSYWNKTNVTVTSNEAISPDGSLNADLAYPNASSSTKYGVKIERATSGLSSSEYTNSVFVKSNNWQWIYLIDPSGFKAVWFDVQKGIVGTQEPNASGSIEDYGNGWYKCTVNTHSSPVAYNYLGVYFSDSDNSAICTNNGTSGVYIYGAQVEQGSYPTSYIPTSGSAVTRLADSCSQTTPDGVIGQTEGTFFIEIGKKTTSSIDLFECGQGSSQHRFLVYTDASSKLKVLVVNNYSVQVNYTSSVNVESNAKIAIGYANNNYAIYLNGSLLITDTSATVPPMNQIAIGSDRGAIVYRLNQIKDLKLYNTRLSNAELAALTQV